jgi:hypothetical protein
MAEKKQPQVILSPDNTLQTLHHRITGNRFGHRVVDGVLKNLTSDSTVAAEIKVEYYDGSGGLIGTGVEIMKIMEPGKTGAFEVPYSGERRWEVKSYKIVSLRRM